LTARSNAYAERWERTVRTECLDWVLVWNRRHLEHVLAQYLAHYNTARPHRGIDLDVPVSTAEPPPANLESIRRIERTDVLGGLIHDYRQAA
jgi:transposase InsO family protein